MSTRKSVACLMLAFMLVPAVAKAGVHAETTSTLTWDGKLVTDLSGVPGAPDIDWSKSKVPYAKLHFSAATACTDFDGAEIVPWEAQYQGGTTDYLANKTGVTKTSTAVNADISYDQYVSPGAAYVYSGYGYCDGADPLTWDSDWFFTSVVEVPPVISSVSLKSPKTLRYFNKLKVGETLKIEVTEYTPRSFSSAIFDPRVFVVVEGAGVAKKEYDITDRTENELTDVKPTQKGTLTLKVKVQNYLYYRDDWHNVNMDWQYQWKDKFVPDFATTLFSQDSTCDTVFDGVPCANYGKPIFRAVPYTLESAAMEIPVEDSWCLIQDRAEASSTERIASEGCHSCSSHYNANAEWYEDACAPANPDKPGLSTFSCASAGSGLAFGWLGLALLPALRRRRS
ncbi:MAG: hypothetical protein QM765_29555 [Myxococcales bacterium]